MQHTAQFLAKRDLFLTAIEFGAALGQRIAVVTDRAAANGTVIAGVTTGTQSAGLTRS